MAVRTEAATAMTAFWGRTGLELSLQVVVFLFCRYTGALHPQSDERVPRGIGRQEALLRGRPPAASSAAPPWLSSTRPPQ